jgi:hypothetical protein
VLQFYDAENRSSDVLLTFSTTPKHAEISNILEETGNPLPVKTNTVRFPLRARGVATIKVAL